MANKDPSDIIIIIRRSQSGDEVCESSAIPVQYYTSGLALIPLPISDTPTANAVTAMKSVE